MDKGTQIQLEIVNEYKKELENDLKVKVQTDDKTCLNVDKIWCSLEWYFVFIM